MASWFDRTRRLLGRALPGIQPFKPQGGSGTAVYGGYVEQRERSPDWIGRQKYITASDLATNISIVAAGTHYFLNMVAHPKWTAKPVDDSPEAKGAAEFAESIMGDMQTPWYRVVRKAAIYRFYGFSTQEWIAKKREDGLIGLLDIESRPQHTIERWEVEQRTGKILGVWQRPPSHPALLGIPRDKLLYIVDDTLTDSPEGVGIFRHLAEPYNRLKKFYELEGRAYERDLRGIPIGRAPLSKINDAVKQNRLSDAEAKKLIQSMEDIIQTQVKQSNTGLLMDSQPYENMTATGPATSSLLQWSFELLNGPGLGLSEISAAIDRTQREMARIIGTEHLMMGDQGGNRALAVDKSRNLYLIANSVLQNIVSQVQADVLWPIWYLNGIPEDLMPELGAEDVSFKDVAQITAALTSMAQAGATLAPDDPVVDEVRELLGVSRAEPMDPGMMGGLGGDEEEEELPEDPLAAPVTPSDVMAQGKKSPYSVSGTTASQVMKKLKLSDLDKEYDPSQPRDDQGQFGETGGSSSSSSSNTVSMSEKPKLTGEKEYAISNYTANGYRHINDSLRTGKGDLDAKKPNGFAMLSESTKKQIQNLDVLTSSQEFTEDGTLFRGFTGKKLAGKLKPGSTFTDNAFVSTSSSLTGVDRAMRDTGARGDITVLKITVPKGAKGYSVSAPSGPMSTRPNEGEVLLPRNSKFKVVGSSKVGDRNVVEVELVK